MAEKQGPSISISGSDKGDGLFITDDNGNFYYLRPEILAQARMSAEDVARVKDLAAKGQDRELSADDLQGVVGGAAGLQIPGVIHVSSQSLMRLPGGGTMEGTIMCPW